MKHLFICDQCGALIYHDTSLGTQDLFCDSCANNLTWNNSYPPINAQDFVLSACELYEAIKTKDKENLNFQQEILLKEGCPLDTQRLGHFYAEYEKILTAHNDNDDSVWLSMFDQFEDFACTELGNNYGVCLTSSMNVFSKNRLRKPFVIIVASLVEQLFNDYFHSFIFLKYTQENAKEIVQAYTLSGISKKIEFLNEQMEISLLDAMQIHSKGFYNRWANLRNSRNYIIHRNDTYISQKMVLSYNKIVNESVSVFGLLRSDIIKKYSNDAT